MSITVADAYKLPSLRNITILTGESGLYNCIDRMGILDYEFISYKIQGEFVQNDFVLSSFLFAKDDVNLLVDAVKELIDNGVSCLGIKNVYYKELPQDLIQYAKEHSFSIFLFGHDVYFEDIITEVTDAVRSVDSQLLTEMKIDNLVQNELSRTLVRELALELNPEFKDNHCVIYCIPHKNISDRMAFHSFHRLAQNEYFCEGRSLLSYKQGMLAIISHDEIQRLSPRSVLQELVANTGLSASNYTIGISNQFDQIHFLDRAIKESLYAARLCPSQKSEICCYNDIGLYKLILPFMESFWFREFYNGIIEPLKTYDAKYSADLLHTAIVFVRQEGSIKRTAEVLFQHENTIRYRINKIKEILHLESSSNEFYAQLTIAVHMELALHAL